MSSYRIREATIADVDVLVHHRVAMFVDMHVSVDRQALEPRFRAWLGVHLAAGTYRAWLAEDERETVAAGGGLSVVPWPPGPSYPGEQLGFVYNMYTEPAHRRRGLGRRILEAMHAWGRAHGIASVALNASADGRPLYEAMGYRLSPHPMMFRAL